MKPTQHEKTISPEAPPLAAGRRQLLLLTAGLILVSGALVAAALATFRTQQIESSERLIASFAHVIEEQTNAAFQRVDQRLKYAATGLAQLEAAGKLTEQTSSTLLSQQANELPFVETIWVLDAAGRLQYASDIGNIGHNQSDRDYFQIYRTQPQTAFYVGLPVRNSKNGTWQINVARPLSSPDGAFAGVIVAALETSHFESRWREIDLGTGGAITLWRRSGDLMMRSPINNDAMGKNFNNADLFQEYFPKSATGVYLAACVIDGELRSNAYRTLSTRPDLVIAVGQSYNEILRPWLNMAKLALVIWASAAAVVVVLSILLNRNWQQRARAEAASREMAERLAFATEAAAIGIWDWDVVADECFSTPRCSTMLGDDPVDALRSREQWLARIHPQDRQAVAETMRAVIEDSAETYQYEARVQHADSSYRWVRVAGHVLERNAHGMATRILGIRIDITDSKNAEIALQDSEKRYRALVEWSPEPMCVHRDAKIIYVNPAAIKLIGAHSAQELIGKPVLELIHPDSRQLVMSRLKGIANGDIPPALAEFKLLKLDGSAIDVEERGIAITYEGKSAVYVCMRDITAPKEEANALRKSEVALAEAQRVAQIGSWTWHAPTDTYEWSDELFNVFGLELSSSTLNFEDQLKLFTVESAALLAAAAQKAMQTGEAYKLELERKCDDDERRWVGIRGEVQRSASGRIFGLRGTAQNISERKRAEAARASLEAQLRESQKMQAIGTLAGGIAHDFNNILATIMGNATLARQDVAGNLSALQSLDEITKAGARARDLVQQILSFSRREPTEKKCIALDGVVNESMRLLRATLPSRVALDVQCEADLPSMLADANQIQQVLINLVTNAVQAMRGCPGRIAIRLGAVMVDDSLAEAQPALRALVTNHSNRTLRLVVSDDGPGMDATTLARIFEPFFTTKSVDEGTGLGLSVVHGIVQAHEGAIVVDSQPGLGTSFSIYFPATDAPASAGNACNNSGTYSALTAPRADKGQHIAYIDDDEALAFLVQRTLERRGYRVSIFTDQREALAALRADPAAFDLVVTDYNMPGMSGLDVARAVREIRANLPLAIASGFIDETLLAEAEGAGVRELIFKANAVEDLCDAFARLMHKIDKGRAPAQPVAVSG